MSDDIEDPALHACARDDNLSARRAALSHRARSYAAASTGSYTDAMEAGAVAVPAGGDWRDEHDG